jgi:hypothetical protein
MLIRRASRLLLVDGARRVLLFKYEDDRGTWWATPGGGLEKAESFEEAYGMQRTPTIATYFRGVDTAPLMPGVVPETRHAFRLTI